MKPTSFLDRWVERDTASREEASEPRGQRRLRVALWLALSAVAVLPIFLVSYAPLYDYYNWVYQGRIVADLLHAGPDTYASAHRFYSLSRTPVPNSAAPFAIGVLTMMMSSEMAGRVFLAVCVLLFAFGYGYLVRTMQGRPTVMELFGFPWAAGYFYYKGYESYLISLPVAFIAIARLHRMYSRHSSEATWAEMAGISLLGAALFACHLVGWLVFAVALIVYGALLIQRGDRRNAGRLASSAAPALVMLAFYTASRMQNHTVASVYYRHLLFSVDKGVSMVDPMTLFLRADPFSQLVPLFPVNAAALVLLALVVAVNMERPRWPVMPASLTAIVLAGCALLIPFANFSDLNRPDERLVLPALLIGLAAVPWKAFSARRGASLAIVVAGIFAFHLAADTHASRLAGRISDATTAAVPADATVLTLTINEGPLHGGCGSGAGPTIGPMSILWLELRRLDGMPLRQVDLLETSLLRARTVDPGEPQLAVMPYWIDGVRSHPTLAAQLAAQYPYVEVFGCQGSVDEVKARFAGSYHQIAAGDNYAVLATPGAAP
jgi:hypothetical protein